jgi:SAM-dependent methyltransferase
MTLKTDLEYIPCALCGADDFEPLVDITQFYFSTSQDEKICMVICRRCGLVYSNPQVTVERNKQFYNNGEWYPLRVASYKSDNPLEKMYRDQFEYSKLILERHLRQMTRSFSGSVLDIGFGVGSFLAAINEACPQAGLAGCEPDPACLAFAGKNLPHADLRGGIFEDQEFLSESFDAIFMSNVIPHMKNPNSLLKKIRGLVKPNGFIYIDFLDVAGYYWGDLSKKFNTDDHHFEYSPSTLTRLLSKNGFKVTEDFPVDYHLLAQNSSNMDQAKQIAFRGLLALKADLHPGPFTDENHYHKVKNFIKDYDNSKRILWLNDLAERRDIKRVVLLGGSDRAREALRIGRQSKLEIDAIIDIAAPHDQIGDGNDKLFGLSAIVEFQPDAVVFYDDWSKYPPEMKNPVFRCIEEVNTKEILIEREWKLSF